MKKVKVVFGESRLLIPCGDGKDKVERLVEDINKRFQSHLGDPTARAKELTTSDGFLVNPHDVIDHVIDDSVVLHALDYATWLKVNLTLLEKAGHKLMRPDYAGGNWRPPYRYAEIGKHKHNKIYIKIGSASDVVDRLELFDLESLRTFGKENDRALIAHKEVKETTDGTAWDWSVQVHFIIEKGVVVAAELSVRSTSDARPQIEVVPINGDLTLGAAVVKQTASFPKPAKAYTLPETKTEGPAYDAKDFISAHLAPSGIVENPVPENVAKGDLGIEIKQKDATQPDQSWASGGRYSNLFYNHVALFNPLEKDVAIVKVKSEYEKDGEWIEMKTSLGSKSSYYRYSMGYHDDGFVLEPNQRLNLAIESAVEVKAAQYDRERRAHHSLPSPFRIRITIVDKEGKSSQLVIEHSNQPLVLPTKESRDKSEDRVCDFWISADDIDGEARVWIEAYHVPEEHRVQFASKPSDKSKYCYKDDLDYLFYLAKKDNKTEIEVEELTTQDEGRGYSQKATALVDLENNWVYAFRFEIKTNTSTTVGHYLLPDLTKA